MITLLWILFIQYSMFYTLSVMRLLLYISPDNEGELNIK